ncbi:MAG: response regulator [Bdellovibrionales bacterium RBG_16_40_8]|nr:MAG: response regulator [Bdellovibrionales bacterium RBG_16_40_8]
MKVLIVDDEPLIRRSLVRAFANYGHVVFEADDGVKGLEIWQAEAPDIILLDILMPGLTGPQVLDQIENRGNAKIILMSAYAGEYNLKKANELGADMFIPKPFTDIFAVVQIAENLMVVN